LKIYKKKILVIDCEPRVRTLFRNKFPLLGYDIFLASNNVEAFHLLKKERPHIVLLDVLLPNLDGFELCYKIKKVYNIPLIILTALNTFPDRLRSVELGADDYIIKPFLPKELDIKIRILLDRCCSPPEPVSFSSKLSNTITIGSFTINFDQRFLSKNNKPIKLTDFEFRMLELLIENAGQPISRSSILDNIWGYTPQRIVDSRVVDVHISRLRLKLEENPKSPDFILTVRGIGYLFRK